MQGTSISVDALQAIIASIVIVIVILVCIAITFIAIGSWWKLRCKLKAIEHKKYEDKLDKLEETNKQIITELKLLNSNAKNPNS